MIVVGSPIYVPGLPGARATGTAVAIARAARATGAQVQIVGKVGEDPQGDAVLLDLATAGIGHVAVLRDPSGPTGAIQPITPERESAEAAATAALTGDEPDTPPAPVVTAAPPTLHAEDLDLALRYLTDYRVIVVAESLPDTSIAVIARAATWASAALVALMPAGSEPSHELPGEATVFEAPPADSDSAFAGVIGSYAAALDAGQAPDAAFAAVADAAGWSRTGSS